MKRVFLYLLVLSWLFILTGLPAESCTVFRLTAGDGSIVLGRSMEFALDLKYDLIVVPRNKAYVSPSPDGKEGLKWKTKWGYVAVGSFGMDFGVNDGMNEKGLAVSLLWFENDMKWQEAAPSERERTLAQTLVGDWILGTFSKVEDVKREIQKLKVFQYTDPVAKFSPTVHFIVYDAHGGCIVIEYEEGACHVYDNPLGIMTNAPRFPWQVANLRQYLGMSSAMPNSREIAGMTFLPTGHGSGMMGLPGDLTPPSRFVRLAVLTRFSDRQPDAAGNLNLAQHILNTFEIPSGLITDTLPDGKTVLKETTQWSSFRDLANRIFYFKTYDNQNLRKIDFQGLDFSGNSVKRIPMFGIPENFPDITDQAR